MTQFWKQGVRVNVWAVDEQPRRIVWNERVHPVEDILNQWRTDRGWWRLRVWRDTFELRTTTGLHLEVYHDLITNRWYVQRWYD